MAILSDFGTLDYDQIADYKTSIETIDTMLGMLSFPLVEESVNGNGITISVFEKSLFGKKGRGYISFSYIEDTQADTTKFIYENGEPAPKSAEVLLGLEFSCVYNEYYVPSQVQTYKLGTNRKQILSYGVLMQNIEAKYNAVSQLHLEQIQTSMFSPTERFLSRMCSSINDVKQKFEVFEKLGLQTK